MDGAPIDAKMPTGLFQTVKMRHLVNSKHILTPNSKQEAHN